MKLITSLLLCILILSSCTKEKKEASAQAAKASYSFNSDSTSMKWTAYKFTERVGVSGSFDKITISGTKEAKTAFAVFENASFSIETKSVDSNNPDRDGKLVAFFFGKMKETSTITGSVESINADGSGSMKIRMNKKEKSVPFQLSQNGNSVHMASEINLEAFLAQAAVESLNEVCKVLHTSADGISKLWPDVKLELRVVLN